MKFAVARAHNLATNAPSREGLAMATHDTIAHMLGDAPNQGELLDFEEEDQAHMLD